MKKSNKGNPQTKNLKLGAAIYELVLGVPFLGGTIVMGLFYLPLVASLVLGIMGLVLSDRYKEDKNGHILQIITGAIGWIPIVGWGMHIASGIVLLLNALKK